MLEKLAALQGTRDMASFRSRLKQLMLGRSLQVGEQLSQTEVARGSGVSLPTIQRWYDPKYTFNRVDADTLYSLLDYFHCNFEDLIERVDNEE